MIGKQYNNCYISNKLQPMKKLLILLMFICLGGFIKAQDKIKLKSGDIIKSRVMKISGGKIIYKEFYDLKGKDCTVAQADVEYIKYQSGKVVFMDGKNKMKKTTTTTKPAVKKTTTKKK